MRGNPDKTKEAELAKRKTMSNSEKLAEYENTQGTKGRMKTLPKSLSCSADLSKKLLIGMNCIFLIFAIVILAIGAYTLGADNPLYKETSLPAGIMFLGGVVLLLSLMGCFGALQENRIVLMVYAIILIIIILIQIVLAAVVLADRSSVQGLLRDQWLASPCIVRSEVQLDYNCCGFDYYTTNQTEGLNCSTIKMTDWCPPPPVSGSGNGCLQQLQSDIQSRLSLLGGFVITFAILQVFGVIFALVLRAGVLGTYSFQ